MHRPLEGVTVLDLTRLLPGPFATGLLLELGARVIKVEEPRVGDYARVLPPFVGDVGFAFAATNRGKESVAVDLKRPEGVDVVRKLAARADVLVESFRPGVMDRLGLGTDALRASNPRLVVCALSGYGQDGPLRDAPGHDLNYQAVAGVTGLTGPAERPVLPAVPLADLSGALYAVVGILAALRARERSGDGAVLDVALADAALALNGLYLARAAAGDPPERGRMELAGALPGYDTYQCADDGWIALGCLEEKFWQRFCAAVDRADWVDRHVDPDVRAEVAALFLTRPRDAWALALADAGVPATPVLAPAEALRHAHVRARFGNAPEDAVPGPAFPLTRAPLAGPLPALGEHSTRVLAEIGYSDADARALVDAGVVVQWNDGKG